MKTKKKKEKINWLITIVIIIFLILVAFIIFNKYQENKKVKQSNIGFFKAVECMKECPVEALISPLGSREMVSQKCINECMLRYDKEIHNINITKENSNKLLTATASPSFLSCTKLLKESPETLNSCINNWLKQASEKYSYLKNP